MSKESADLILVEEFVVPASTGSTTVDSQYFRPDLFPAEEDRDVLLMVDGDFQKHLDTIGPDYANGPFKCIAYQMSGGGAKKDNAVLHAMVVGEIRGSLYLHPSQVCGILKYLGGEGAHLLVIPEGKDDVCILLCYVDRKSTADDGQRAAGDVSVMYIEHELEQHAERPKRHEIHLHLDEMNEWGDGGHLVLTVP